MKITFITGNVGKAKEVSRYLAMLIEHRSLELDEIQSLDLAEIVKDKAERAFAQIGQPVLVEDVAFVFHALGRLPGPFIKWFEKELGNEKLCRLVDGQDRSCTASVCYGFHDGKKVELFGGSMSGQVAETPKGSNSFGWAPVFVPTGFAKTYAELTDEEQATIAMRKIALTKMHDFLKGRV